MGLTQRSAARPATIHGLPVWAVMTVVVILAGAAYPATSAALDDTTPTVVAVVRAVAGGLLLAAVLPLIGSRLPRTRSAWAWALIVGTGNTAITLVAISEGTSRAGAAVAAVLLNSSPFFVAVLGRLFLNERISPLRAIGLVVGFAGVLLVVFSDPGDVAEGTDLAIGFALALIGAVAWAASGLTFRALLLRDPSLDVPGATAAQFLCGGVVLLPLLLFDSGETHWDSASLWASLAFLVVGGQVLVYVGFNAALGQWPSSRVYAWTFLVPAVAVAVEATRGNLPSAVGTLGLLVVIAGVAIVNLPAAESRAATRAPIE